MEFIKLKNEIEKSIDEIKKTKPKGWTKRIGSLRRKYNRKKMFVYKNRLQRHATEAELFLINLLKLNEIEFQFQRGVVSSRKLFIVDFYIPLSRRKGIVIEVDGGIHNVPRQKAYDAERQKWIKTNRFPLFLRFTNEEIFNNPEYVVKKIKSVLYSKMQANQSLKPTTQPPAL